MDLYSKTLAFSLVIPVLPMDHPVMAGGGGVIFFSSKFPIWFLTEFIDCALVRVYSIIYKLCLSNLYF